LIHPVQVPGQLPFVCNQRSRNRNNKCKGNYEDGRTAGCACRNAPTEQWVPWKRGLGKCTVDGKLFCANGGPYSHAEECLCFRNTLTWVPFREVQGVMLGKCKRVSAELRPFV